MIIARTPLRISFFGGGTDIPAYYTRYEGSVIGTSIDKYTYVLIFKRYDDRIVVSYTQHENVSSVEDIKHDLVREAAKFIGLKNGFEIKTFSDVPSEGSGLGSSSSILIGLLNAMSIYSGKQMSNVILAKEAARIEVDVLKNPIGVQDQYLCALGGPREIHIYRDGYVASWSNVIVPSMCLHLFYTGLPRSSNHILKDQCSRMDENIEKYHAIQDLVHNWSDFPSALREDWELKKLLSPLICTPEIEVMIRKAYDGGAKAVKLLGAGGGGFLLVYCNTDEYQNLLASMEGYRELPFELDYGGARIIFNSERTRNLS